MHIIAAMGWLDGIDILPDWGVSAYSEDAFLFETLHKAARTETLKRVSFCASVVPIQ